MCILHIPLVQETLALDGTGRIKLSSASFATAVHIIAYVDWFFGLEVVQIAFPKGRNTFFLLPFWWLSKLSPQASWDAWTRKRASHWPGRKNQDLPVQHWVRKLTKTMPMPPQLRKLQAMRDRITDIARVVRRDRLIETSYFALFAFDSERGTQTRHIG